MIFFGRTPISYSEENALINCKKKNIIIIIIIIIIINRHPYPNREKLLVCYLWQTQKSAKEKKLGH